MQPNFLKDQPGVWQTRSLREAPGVQQPTSTRWSQNANINSTFRFGAGPRRAVLLVALGVFSAAIPARFCFGQVQLPTVNLGETNFEDGFASPGWFLQEFPESYVSGGLGDGNGNKIPGQSRLIVDSTTTHVVFVSQKRVLRGVDGSRSSRATGRSRGAVGRRHFVECARLR
jgi:hypothetical protein